MMKWLVLSVSLILTPGLAGFAPAQNSTDTIATKPKTDSKIHSPTKATILAATLPGAGQAYNRKYWKIPIVYVGLTAAGYMLVTNQKNYKYSKANYIAATDGIDSTENQSGQSPAVLLSNIDTYRRYRDMSFLALLAWHGLTIIDANVDAHFFNWDVSEDLSLRIRPRALFVGPMQPGLGISLIFNNKN
ncbi:MAG: DUF5683 domain-containing protein [Bacteroidales bacterium]|jgi:hypothetical protein